MKVKQLLKNDVVNVSDFKAKKNPEESILTKIKELCTVLTEARGSFIRGIEVDEGTVLIGVYTDFPEHQLRVSDLKSKFKPVFTKVQRIKGDDNVLVFQFDLANELDEKSAMKINKTVQSLVYK